MTWGSGSMEGRGDWLVGGGADEDSAVCPLDHSVEIDGLPAVLGHIHRHVYARDMHAVTCLSTYVTVRKRMEAARKC